MKQNLVIMMRFDKICIYFFKKQLKVIMFQIKKCYLFKSDEILIAPNAYIMIEKRQNAECAG